MYKISELRKPEVAGQFNACSTLYVPPLKADDPFPAHVVEQLFGKGASTLAQVLYPVAKWDIDNKLCNVSAYGPHEQAVVAAMEHWDTPADYRALCGSPAVQQLMMELSLRPALQAKYKADPKAVVDATPGLTSVESVALLQGSPGAITRVMKRHAGEVVTVESLRGFEAAQAPLNLTVVVVVILVAAGAAA